MSSDATLREQLRGSLEIFLVTAGLIIGGIMSVILTGDLIANNLIQFYENNYGPQGLFNLGLPDILWVLIVVVIISVFVKIMVSLLMPIVLPFHGYCPKCGVKPLALEKYCAECNTPLYRKRLSKFDLKLFLFATFGLLVFIVIWYILAVIVGVRPGVIPFE